MPCQGIPFSAKMPTLSHMSYNTVSVANSSQAGLAWSSQTLGINGPKLKALVPSCNKYVVSVSFVVKEATHDSFTIQGHSPTYLFHILPKMPGGGLCSFKLWRRATRVGSLGLLFSWSEANRGPEPRRPEVVGETGEVAEDSEETELERCVLSMMTVCVVFVWW